MEKEKPRTEHDVDTAAFEKLSEPCKLLVESLYVATKALQEFKHRLGKIRWGKLLIESNA